MSKIVSLIRALKRNERGSTAITFGLTLMPMVLMVGASIDYANAVRTRQLLQGSTDATALSLGQKGMEQDNAALLSQAQGFMTAIAMDPNAKVMTAEKQTFNGTKTKICVTTQTIAYNAVMKLVGYDYVVMHADSCVTSGAASFEIGLVLDTSGSMNNGAGGSTKIAALRTAGKNFIDYMYSSQMNGAKVKVAVAPFSWGVAVDPSTYRSASWVDRNGQSSLHWLGYTGQSGLATSRFDLFGWLKAKNSDWDWKGCFESLPYPLNIQDTAPSGTDSDALYVPSLWPDEPDGSSSYVDSYLYDNSGACTTTATSESSKQSRVCKYKNPSIRSSYGPNLACSSTPMIRLSGDKTALKNYIDSLDADGNTNIHEGVMWGWRAISPNSVFGDGKTYDTPDNRKVLVVMTDGMNTWGAVSNSLNKSYYSAYGFFTSTDGTGRNPRLPTQKIDGSSMNNPPSTGSQGREAMDDLTRRACQGARNAGVVIYTIGFTTSTDPIDAAGKQLLKDCAGDLTRYFEATDAASINTVFGQIAASIGKLRILE